jgi:hypothetical protein
VISGVSDGSEAMIALRFSLEVIGFSLIESLL